jgi:tetratricopeptide (TPR) repeat protein
MSAPSIAHAQESLRRGQDSEARGEFAAALACYDEAIAALRRLPNGDQEVRRLLGVAWMNCGNALQRFAGDVSLASAVKSYDEAIALLRTLPVETVPELRNHLGAAWLNRGHALITGGRTAEAVESFGHAIGHLEKLPIGDDPYFRLNLAGAWTNLAHAHLTTSPETAQQAARTALALLADVEHAHAAFAEMSLRARRALVTAIGGLLVTGGAGVELASEASDAIDDGLALARHWEERDPTPPLRPLALRLFRLGAQLYRTHQPHFLAEFLLENLAHAGFAEDAAFRAAADEALGSALAALHRPQLLVADTPESMRLLETARSLRAAQEHLSTLRPLFSSPSA